MNQYFLHDARKVDSLPLENPVDLIVTSPPYFDMKDYNSENQIGYGQNYEEYLNDIEVVFKKSFSITKDTSSLWIIVDILKKDGNIKLLPFDVCARVKKSGWKLRDIIIWEKDKTIPYTRAGEMRNIFEYILYFTKTNNFKFYRERITSINDLKEWWQKHPERYSPTGKSPTNIWKFPIPLQGSWGKKYIKHFCPLPEELIERIIHLCSDTGDIVFDPFAGSGAVLTAAYKLKRKYVGSDLNADYQKMFLTYIKTIKQKNVNKIYKNKTIKMFSETIMKLRALKLPKKLVSEYYKLKPENKNTIHSIFHIPNNLVVGVKPTNKLIGCIYYLVVSDPSRVEIGDLDFLLNRKPLSKYGIYAQVKLIASVNALKVYKKLYRTKSVWCYPNGETYKEGVLVTNRWPDIKLDSKINRNPNIYSSINLSIKELNIVM